MQTTKKHAVREGKLAAEGRRPLIIFARLFLLAKVSLFPTLATMAFCFVALCFLTACNPPGAQAVLKGKKLLDRGDFAAAAEELRAGTQLMPTNALAFEYLGLALHQAGKAPEAERAYLRALTLDHDLTEVHYNLGCLWLGEGNKLEQAKSELTAYTLRRPNSAEGWLKLGQAQLRSRELAPAEKNIEEALRLDPHNPEALTALGLVRYQRKRVNDAAQLFTKALKEQPNYAPALLNLAIVAQQDLNDPRLALQKYREYLAVKPAPENIQSVSLIARQLDQQLNPPARQPVTNVAAQTGISTNVTKLPPPESAHVATNSRPPLTNTTHSSALVRSEPPTNSSKNSVPALATKPAPATSAPVENLEVTKLGAEPVIKPAEDLANAPTTARSAQPELPATNSPLTPSSPDNRQQKRGFFQKINPINLFARDTKPASTHTGTGNPGATSPPQPGETNGSPTAGMRAAAERKFPRYAYRSPETPSPGDRTLAAQAFAQGVQQQQAHRLSEAIQSYRHAAQLDPAFYDAHYNLGLAATENGNLALALAAYETALAVEPESLDARYNFGLVLKQAGYALDAVTEFEKILARYPNDGRTHLALGNLYAQQLQEPLKARQHYLAVLALAPQSPQAGAIRYWLSDHPR